MSSANTGGAIPALTADCQACMGICCVAPSFEKSAEFALSKPALTPCPHLDNRDRCKIYRNLEWHGFSACEKFDCKGAGQYLTQVVYPGKSWRDNPDQKAAMAESYRRLRRVHDLLEIFTLAKSLPLDADQEAARQAALSSLIPKEGWSEESLKRSEADGLFGRLQTVLATFRSAYARKP
ncbi:hypothetical protein [Aliiroseovarius crassostreae]|uniref:Uncharacterized protein n=1 Tax=Aliiroseovarius crassostreae TaxID=154981 RepID=A0A9Q9HBU0_9RHOB|nr:hypothetical protein [Aliiroseovarius crassostreae]UWP88077.1 hypothetical protein K3J57_09085 [Aliiroseovarius crassostreae]UWP94417.1 hypothetical protein K3X48_09205 [Aliiroseovarius crassostreae]UWP97542.1 hypothetical protein K3X53_09035 [Aliiroseovarius crassostreae]